MSQALTTYLAKPSDVEILQLIRDLEATKSKLRNLLGTQADAVLGPEGELFLLQTTYENLSAKGTDRDSAEAALRQRESILGRMHAVVRVGSWELDLANLNALEGNTLRWSDEVFRIFGHEPGKLEVTVENFFSVIHPEDRDRVRKAVMDAITTGNNFALDHRIVLADGTVRDVHEDGQIVKDTASGRPLRMTGIAHDITDRKIMEAQYLRAQRMESIGTLASGIAHDLNNVLAPIIMGVDLLRNFGVEGPSKEAVDGIERSAKRGASLVKQVLSFARGEEGARIVVHVGEVIREMESTVRTTFPENILWKTDIAGDLGLIESDPALVYQVLLKLCTNARDAMRHGGSLTISARNSAIAAHDEPARRGVPIGHYVHIEVADTGRGIPKEHLDKIFDPFFTTKDLGEGTGLGLSTVLGIVRSHDGFIHVDSKPEEGSTFNIYFPMKSNDGIPNRPGVV